MRKLLGWLLTALTAGMIIPVIGEFFVELAKERGWYDQPGAKVSFIVECLSAITDLPGFYTALGFVAGGWFFYWVFHRLMPPQEGGLKPGKNGAFLRLQFGADGATPNAIQTQNVWRWYALTTIFAGTVPAAPVMARSWTVFLTFDKPLDIKQVVVEADGPLPIYEVKDTDSRSVVIAFMGDLSNRTVDLKILSVPGYAPPMPPLKHRIAADYVTGQRIGANFTREQGEEVAIMYKAVGARLVDRLRVYLDLSQGGLGEKVNFYRMKIGELTDVVRGKTFTIPIMHRHLNGDRYTFKWNTADKLAPEFTLGGKCEGRISLIGDDEGEQYLYFMTVPTMQHGEMYFEVIVLGAETARKWEG